MNNVNPTHTFWNVQLSKAQWSLARATGLERQASCLRKNLPDKHGFKGKTDVDALRIHIGGAAAEIAVAQGVLKMGSFQPTVDTFKSEPDIPPDIEVRWRSKPHYELLVRPDDSSEKRYVLVTGEVLWPEQSQPPCFVVHPWILGADAKSEQWKQSYGNRPSAFFIPHSALQEAYVARMALVS